LKEVSPLLREATPSSPAEVAARQLVARLPARAWRPQRRRRRQGPQDLRLGQGRADPTRLAGPGVLAAGPAAADRRGAGLLRLLWPDPHHPGRAGAGGGVRWAVEECFQAAKDQVGLDHYQVRRNDAWYRHLTLVLVAQAFLVARQP
jgi:hypothetical protein